MGYHINKINKGEFGKISKIKEEFYELMDANEQNNPILELVELSDLVGAIKAYAGEKYDITLEEIIKMTNATERAFIDGSRK